MHRSRILTSFLLLFSSAAEYGQVDWAPCGHAQGKGDVEEQCAPVLCGQRRDGPREQLAFTGEQAHELGRRDARGGVHLRRHRAGECPRYTLPGDLTHRRLVHDGMRARERRVRFLRFLSFNLFELPISVSIAGTFPWLTVATVSYFSLFLRCARTRALVLFFLT